MESTKLFTWDFVLGGRARGQGFKILAVVESGFVQVMENLESHGI